jgi:hypothetical protein
MKNKGYTLKEDSNRRSQKCLVKMQSDDFVFEDNGIFFFK